ncbi:MAG TPA: cytochrome c oxidase subunit II [Steroidobacteraceae bacterium]|nr:cytochrome c oxidase subunit II [Steroidobacteraceae bacterium]
MPKKMVRRALAATAVIGLSLLGSNPAMAAWTLNLREGVTELSREIYGLHMLILWVCVAIAVAVFSVMIYSIATFRKSKGAVPATFDHSTGAEVTWTIIPVVILVAMAIPAARTLVKIEDASGSELTVKVTGYQWKWQYDYVDHGVAFFSTLSSRHNEARQVDSGVDVRQVDDYLLDVDNPLVVPVGKKVRVLVTAADVIHNWWVPDFGLKKDAIPGYINELWFRAEKVGTYRGQCAELCGRDHGFMPVVVRVVEQAQFDTWIAGQQAARQAAAAPAAQAAATVAPIAIETPALRVAAAE